MATINTIEDLVQILDDNPRWLEAIRARLLTREVLEMHRRYCRHPNERAAELPASGPDHGGQGCGG